VRVHAFVRFRLAALGLVALAVLLALPGGALAGKPTREVVPSEDFVVPAGAACAFAVLAHAAGGVAVLTFTDAAGNPVRQLVTLVGGGGTQTLTNLATGTSLTVRTPGPAFFAANPDGSATLTGLGPGVWPGPLPGSTTPGLFLIRGRFVVTFDAAGNPTAFSHVGPPIEDLCPQLAG
jgi:hypothetical protein